LPRTPSARLASKAPSPFLPTNSNSTGTIGTCSVQTVHCTQNNQGLFARIDGLVNAGGSDHPSAGGPATYYTCSGTATSGQPLYWCVTHPATNNQYTQTPGVTSRLATESCPN
jgi:hypothetical protein